MREKMETDVVLERGQFGAVIVIGATRYSCGWHSTRERAQAVADKWLGIIEAGGWHVPGRKILAVDVAS